MTKTKMEALLGKSVRLADHVRNWPAYDGKPEVTRESRLTIIEIRGARKTPKHSKIVTFTLSDGIHTWWAEQHDVVVC